MPDASDPPDASDTPDRDGGQPPREASTNDRSVHETPEASAPVAEGGPSESDAGCAADASGPLAAGFTQLIPGADNGRFAVMVLDGTGSPVVAYQKDSGDGSAESISIEIVRYRSACGAWSAPIHVDTFGYQTGNGRQIALAFDASSGTIGIAYQAVVGTLSDSHHYELRYAELRPGASSVTAPERVDVPRADALNPASPGLGMANGRVFLAYQEPFRLCNVSDCAAIVYRSRDASGTWSGEIELPGNGPSGYGDAIENETSLAVDSNGAPAVAWISTHSAEPDGVHTYATFVRPGSAGAGGDAGDAAVAAPSVLFANTDTIGTDAPWIELAFDGTKPRAVVILNRDANYTTDKKTEWFVESDDGVAWKAPVALPYDTGSTLSLFASIALGGGRVRIASATNGGDTTDVFGSPKILSSTNGTTFTIGGPSPSAYANEASWVSAKVGPDGKLQAVMHGESLTNKAQQGVMYFREE